MVLGIELFRKSPDIIKDSERKRFKNESCVDRIIQIDNEWKRVRFVGDELNRIKRLCSNTISDRKKAKEADGDSSSISSNITANLLEITLDVLKPLSVNQIKLLCKELDHYTATNSKLLQDKEDERNAAIQEIGNILHPDVPVSADENNVGIIRMHGEVTCRKLYSHVDLVNMVDGCDTERGTAVAGNRGYYLKGPLVFLEQALIRLALDGLHRKDYTILKTPYFMKKEVMQAVAQLSQFEEELYKVVGKRNADTGDKECGGEEEKFLIATSEQPIAAFHKDEWLLESDLPLKYAGVSSCFRQEVGSHGRDTKGIFRVHQFEKVEQFVITSPHDDISWKQFHMMIANAEDFYKSLGIGYRVVNIVSGDLNNAAAMKYDLEAWFPGSGAFRELVSCSNCTDYQSRSLLVRYGQVRKENQQAEFVHMLNATLCATTRVVCCILETYQDEDGVVVPEILRPYMPEHYKVRIPFLKKAISVDVEDVKKKGGKTTKCESGLSLNVDLFRMEKGGAPDKVRESQKRRFKDETLVDKVIQCDEQWRKVRYNGDVLNKLKNSCSKAIQEKMKAKEDVNAISESSVTPEMLTSLHEISTDMLQKLSIQDVKRVRENIDPEMSKNTELLVRLEKQRNDAINEIGNLLHPSVPISRDENDVVVIRTFGEHNFRRPFSHTDLVSKVDGYDGERGSAIAGSRAYYLKGPLVFLEQALIDYSLKFLQEEKQYVILKTPFFMKKEAMQAVAQLSDFEEQLYKVVGKRGPDSENVAGTVPTLYDEKFLIATSEQPIAAFHWEEWLSEKDLPLRYAGISACFRQEVGAHGRDTRGIFRVHQFHKVEQFVLTTPHDGESWLEMDRMIGNAEQFYKALGLPYRVINIVSGDLNNAAAMKYDLEAWFPGSETNGVYRELVSCSNCTDYQSRRLMVRYGKTKKMDQQVDYVHMLNATLCATTRVICCILENYQVEDGIMIPSVLQDFMPEKWKTKIPFVK